MVQWGSVSSPNYSNALDKLVDVVFPVFLVFVVSCIEDFWWIFSKSGPQFPKKKITKLTFISIVIIWEILTPNVLPSVSGKVKYNVIAPTKATAE